MPLGMLSHTTMSFGQCVCAWLSVLKSGGSDACATTVVIDAATGAVDPGPALAITKAATSKSRYSNGQPSFCGITYYGLGRADFMLHTGSTSSPLSTTPRDMHAIPKK